MGGLVALAGVTTVANAADTRAVRADDFLNSIGANSAISKRGETLSNTITAARFLGLRWFRVGYESRIPVADLIELHRQTGVRFSYGLMSGGTDLARLLEGARQLAAAGALIALEGNNEPNNWGVTYEGVRGGRTNSWLPVAKLQRDLYQAVKSDPMLKDYPVWSLSENGAQTDNVGLQFLTIPAGAGTLMPNGTRYADYANCHNYLTHPSWPGLHDNQTWIAADPGRACRVDGLHGNYGRTWRRHFPGYSESDLQTLPRVTTETGVTIGGPFTEQVQALLYLSTYLDQFKRGWKHTAIYLLRDRTDEAGNQTSGFYRPDYTPRLAATYLHNLTSILADTPSAKPPGSLDYSIPNPPATVHDLLLQKSDGQFELVVWNERFTGGSDEVTVKLEKPATSVTLFDPTVGTSPARRLTDVAAIPLTLSNHPVVIEMSSQAPPRADMTRLIHLAGTTHDEMDPSIIQPTLLYWQRTGDPALTALFGKWLKVWVDAAARAENGKPAGVLPSAIRWPDGGIAKTDRPWWEPFSIGHNDALYNWPGATRLMTSTLLLAYHTTRDERYLEPIRSMAALRVKHLQPPEGEPGSESWCARRMSGFLPDALAKYRLLTGDTQYDPLLRADASGYVRYRLTGDAAPLEAALRRNAEAFRSNWEAYTAEMRWTDRVMSFTRNFLIHLPEPAPPAPSPEILYGSATGDPGNPLVFPLNAVRWRTAPREIAALVTDSSRTSFAAELYHFGAQSRNLEAEFFLLSPGDYQLALTAAGTDNATPLQQRAIHVEGPRVRVSLELPARRLCLVKVSRQ
jgi:hypothetical protein